MQLNEWESEGCWFDSRSPQHCVLLYVCVCVCFCDLDVSVIIVFYTLISGDLFHCGFKKKKKEKKRTSPLSIIDDRKTAEATLL